MFADDEDEEDDAGWEAEVAKLLENAAVSWPQHKAQQAIPQVPILQHSCIRSCPQRHRHTGLQHPFLLKERHTFWRRVEQHAPKSAAECS